jgi:hypothetical protein
MPGPIVFISHNTVKAGMLEGFRNAFGQVAQALDAEKPGTDGYGGYLRPGG